MKTTTHAWTKNPAALLPSACLALALLAPCSALARNNLFTGSQDRTVSRGSGSATPSGLDRAATASPDQVGSPATSPSAGSGLTRSQPRSWWPLFRWAVLRGGW
jgi:hypothetical protein